MKISQIREYSQNSLKGKRLKSFFLSVLLPTTAIFFRLMELCLASVVLYFTKIPPMKLFYEFTPLWSSFALVCFIFKTISYSAIISGVIWYFSQIVNMNILPVKTSFSEIMGNPQIFKRSIAVILLTKLASFIFLLPAVFFSIMSLRFLLKGYENGNSDIIFLTVHSISLTLLSLVIWIKGIISLAALPFLSLKYSDIKVIRLFFISFKVMRYSWQGFVKIFLFYSGFLLIPFSFIWILPEFMASYSLYINICIKEAEYIAGGSLYSGKSGKTNHSAKISNRKKGHIKTSAD